jgi:tetratricopeptide (TPR) repeat protein
MDTLFVSHSHGDHELAQALKQLIESCFPGHIQVNSSSAAPSAGGISMGSDWLEWIYEQVQKSRFTVVLLTPNSIGKPWLMWEAGAVSGVSLAKSQSALVIPLVYRLSMEQVPSPLRSRQAARGEDQEAVRRVLATLKQSVPLPDAAFNQLADLFVPRYLENVARALAETAPPLTESCVHDWLDRIAYFERTDRRSEIGQLHRAMVSVFAPGENALDTPLDLRLHRRLGDIYLFTKRPQEAAKQYELALRLAPRDIFILHKRGLALLEAGDEPGAKQMLDYLLTIDPHAGTWSTEIAGLKGRLFWQRYQRGGTEADLRAARDAYAEGLELNADSHYMADNVGQLSLLLGERERAADAFRRGLAALERTGDRGYWAVATRASCHFGLGEREEGLEALRQVLALRPDPAALESIRRGFVRLHQGLRSSEQDLKACLAILSERESAAEHAVS